MASSHPWKSAKTKGADLDPSAAREAFQVHRDALFTAVTDALPLANSLYSEGIISRDQLNHAQLVGVALEEKKVKLFGAIEARLRSNPEDFPTLLDVLDSDPHLYVFPERIWSSYLHCKVCLN